MTTTDNIEVENINTPVKRFLAGLTAGQKNDNVLTDEPLKSIPYIRAMGLSTYFSRFRNKIRIDDYQKFKNSVNKDENHLSLLPFDFYAIKKIDKETKTVTKMSDSTSIIDVLLFKEKDEDNTYENFISVIDNNRLTRFFDVESQNYMNLEDIFMICDNSKLSEHCIYSAYRGKLDENYKEIIIPEEYITKQNNGAEIQEKNNDDTENKSNDDKKIKNTNKTFELATKIKDELANKANFYNYDIFNIFIIEKSEEFYSVVKDLFPSYEHSDTGDLNYNGKLDSTGKSNQKKYLELFQNLTYLYMPPQSLISEIRSKIRNGEKNNSNIFGKIYDALETLTGRGLFFVSSSEINNYDFTDENMKKGYDYNPYISYFSSAFQQLGDLNKHRNIENEDELANRKDEENENSTVNLILTIRQEVLDYSVSLREGIESQFHETNNFEKIKESKRILNEEMEKINNGILTVNDNDFNLNNEESLYLSKKVLEIIGAQCNKYYLNDREAIDKENDKAIVILYERINSALDKISQKIIKAEKEDSGVNLSSNDLVEIFENESWYCIALEMTNEKYKKKNTVRYCVNYIGGMLLNFENIVSGIFDQKLVDPITIMRQFLEIQYILSLYFNSTTAIDRVSTGKAIRSLLYIYFLKEQQKTNNSISIDEIILPENIKQSVKDSFSNLFDSSKNASLNKKIEKFNDKSVIESDKSDLFMDIIDKIQKKVYPISVNNISDVDQLDLNELLKSVKINGTPLNEFAEKYLLLKSKFYYFFTTNFIFQKDNYFFRRQTPIEFNESMNPDEKFDKLFTNGWNDAQRSVTAAGRYSAGGKARVKMLLPNEVIDELNGNNYEKLFEEIKDLDSFSTLNEEDSKFAYKRLFRYGVFRILNRTLYNYVENSQLAANRYYNKMRMLNNGKTDDTNAKNEDDLSSLNKIKDAAETTAKGNQLNIERINTERKLIANILTKNSIEFNKFMIKDSLKGFRKYKEEGGNFDYSTFKRNIKAMRNNCDKPPINNDENNESSSDNDKKDDEKSSEKKARTDFLTVLGNQFNIDRFKRRYLTFSKFLKKELNLNDTDRDLIDLLDFFNSKYLSPVLLFKDYSDMLVNYKVFEYFDIANDLLSSLTNLSADLTDDIIITQYPELKSSPDNNNDDEGKKEENQDNEENKDQDNEEKSENCNVISTDNFRLLMQLIIIHLLYSLKLKNPEKIEEESIVSENLVNKTILITIQDENEEEEKTKKKNKQNYGVAKLLKKMIILYCALEPKVTNEEDNIKDALKDTLKEALGDEDNNDEDISKPENLIKIFTEIPVIYPQGKFLNFFGKPIATFLDQDSIKEKLINRKIKKSYKSFDEIAELILLYIANLRIFHEKDEFPKDTIENKKEKFTEFITTFIEKNMDSDKITLDDIEPFKDVIDLLGKKVVISENDNPDPIIEPTSDLEIPKQQIRIRKNIEVLPLPNSLNNQTIGIFEHKFIETSIAIRKQLDSKTDQDQPQAETDQKNSAVKPVIEKEKGIFVEFSIPRERFVKNLEFDIKQFFGGEDPLKDEFGTFLENNSSNGDDQENEKNNELIESKDIELIQLFDLSKKPKNERLDDLKEIQGVIESNIISHIKDIIENKTTKLKGIRQLELSSWTLNYTLKNEWMDFENNKDISNNIFSTILSEIKTDLDEMEVRIFDDLITSLNGSTDLGLIEKFANDIYDYVESTKKKNQNRLAYNYYRKEAFENQLKAIGSTIDKLNETKETKVYEFDQNKPIGLKKTVSRAISQYIISRLLNKEKFPKFNEFIRPDSITDKDNPCKVTCGVKLHKALQNKIKNGANISSITFLKSNYPSRAVIANVQLTGNVKQIHPVPRFFSSDIINNLKVNNGDDNILGLDDNRLNCLFTFLFTLGKIKELEELKKNPESAKDGDGSYKEESYYFSNVLGELKEKQIQEFILLLLNQYKTDETGSIVLSEAGKNFYKKMMNAIFGSVSNPQTIVPTAEEPDNRNSTRDSSNIEIIGAPIKYFAEKRNHLNMHISHLQKLISAKRKKMRLKPDDHLDTKKADHRKILKWANEKRNMQKKYDNLRVQIGDYLLNLTSVLIYIYYPKIFSHESLYFQEGQTGYLAVITSQMFQSMNSFMNKIKSWLTRIDNKFNVSEKGVGAAWTSKISFELNKILGITGDFNLVDRGSNADFSYIIYPPTKDNDGNITFAKGKIINAHENAAENIVFRALKD